MELLRIMSYDGFGISGGESKSSGIIMLITKVGG